MPFKTIDNHSQITFYCPINYLQFKSSILRNVDRDKINIDENKNRTLQNMLSKEQKIVLGQSKNEQELLRETGRAEKMGTLEIDLVFLAREMGELFQILGIAMK